jgi:hypothetical protein
MTIDAHRWDFFMAPALMEMEAHTITIAYPMQVVTIVVVVLTATNRASTRTVQ